MTRPGLALLLLPLFACGDDQRTPVGDTPPPPAATTDATTTGPAPSDESTTGSLLCPCAAGLYCGASYVPGDPPPVGDAFTCTSECIPADAVGRWCFDDASCCAGTCLPDGLCRSPAETTTDPGTTSGTGTTDPGTSGTGTSSGTGTTSGAGTTGATTGM